LRGRRSMGNMTAPEIRLTSGLPRLVQPLAENAWVESKAKVALLDVKGEQIGLR